MFDNKHAWNTFYNGDPTQAIDAYFESKRGEWSAIKTLWALTCTNGLEWFKALPNNPCPVESILAFHVHATLHRLYSTPFKDVGEEKRLDAQSILLSLDPLDTWYVLLMEAILWKGEMHEFFQPIEALCSWILKERDVGHITRILYTARELSRQAGSTTRMIRKEYLLNSIEFYSGGTSEKKRKL